MLTMISKKVSREYQLPRKVAIPETKKIQTKSPGLYQADTPVTKITLAQRTRGKMMKIGRTV